MCECGGWGSPEIDDQAVKAEEQHRYLGSLSDERVLKAAARKSENRLQGEAEVQKTGRRHLQ